MTLRSPLPHEVVVEQVQEATRRLVRTVDAMPDDEWGATSVLPGWSRAHVVAHLTLNAESLAAVVAGLRSGEPVPMYRSDAGRDADIGELAGQEPGLQRERLLAATTAWRAAADGLAPELREAVFERTPGGATSIGGEIVFMRWREVEIHHADLGLAYGPQDWPEAFVDYLLPLVAWDRGAEHDLVLRTPDGDFAMGTGTGPVVSGRAVDLCWWLLGRGAGEQLIGDLPSLGPWVRRPPAR